MDDLLTVLRLQERVDKLERQSLEHWFVLAMLLSRSGLDEAGVDRAFTLASTSLDEFGNKLTDRMVAERLATPEGQAEHQRMEEERRQHMRRLWREECREDGRIYRDPTT